MIKNKKCLKVLVIKKNMNKSIMVVFEKKVQHPIYKKYVRKKTKLQVHDEKNICNIGDLVEIVECRPISKKKSWILKKILKKNIL